VAADVAGGQVYVGFEYADWVEVFDLATRQFGTPLRLEITSNSLYDLEYLPETGAVATLRREINPTLTIRDDASWTEIASGEVQGTTLAVNDVTQTAYVLDAESVTGWIRSYDYGSGATVRGIDASGTETGSVIMLEGEADVQVTASTDGQLVIAYGRSFEPEWNPGGLFHIWPIETLVPVP